MRYSCFLIACLVDNLLHISGNLFLKKDLCYWILFYLFLSKYNTESSSFPFCFDFVKSLVKFLIAYRLGLLFLLAFSSFLVMLASKFSISYPLLDGGNWKYSYASLSLSGLGCTLLKLALGHQYKTIMYRWIQEVISYG